MKKVSIIIPNYNGEEYIGRCIESVLSRDYSEKEIIVVDDGSTDKSVEVVRNFARDNHEIKLFCLSHSGVNVARKRGLKEATGEYVMFVDSDDFLGHDAISKLVMAMEKNDADIVRCEAEYYPEGKRVAEIMQPHEKEKFLGNEEVAILLATTYKMNSLWGKLYRKGILDAVEAFDYDIGFGEDLLINTEICEKSYRILAINEVGYYYGNDNRKSITRRSDRKTVKKNLRDRIIVSCRTMKFARKNIKSKKVVARAYYQQLKYVWGEMKKMLAMSMNLRSAPIKNSASAFVGNALNILMKFILQKIFIDSLGIEYLGLNGVLTNIVSALSIVELGISNAIIFSLYEPIKKNKTEVVKSLLGFYKKAYNIIALITIGFGAVLMPFLHLIVREPVPGVNMYVAYALVLAGTVMSYLMSYRQSILYATEHGHININIQTIANIICILVQMLILLTTENYYLYLVVNIVTQFARNLCLYKIAERKFPILKDKNVAILEKVTQKDIFKKIRALFVHKIATFVIFSTDNIIISAFIDVATVGLYSSYHMIFSAVETIFSQTLKALTPTVGNMLVDKNVKKNFATFCKIRNINFAVALASSAGILLLSDLFVKIWLGGEYVLSIFTLTTLVAVHFQRMMRESFAVFKEAAGIYHEDRFVPVVESLINIVVSVILVQWLGLPGVFIGTFVSSLALWLYSYPKYVYKRLFGRSYKQYAGEMILYCLIFVAVMTVVWLIKNWLSI